MGEIWKRLRKGRALVLPVCRHGDLVQRLEFRPQVCKADDYGRLGRVLLLRYHPFVSSSNPMGQVCLRSNWDVQCLDRAPVLPGVVYNTAGVTFSPQFDEKYREHQDWRSVPVSTVRELVAGTANFQYCADASRCWPTDKGFERCVSQLNEHSGVTGMLESDAVDLLAGCLAMEETDPVGFNRTHFREAAIFAIDRGVAQGHFKRREDHGGGRYVACCRSAGGLDGVIGVDSDFQFEEDPADDPDLFGIQVPEAEFDELERTTDGIHGAVGLGACGLDDPGDFEFSDPDDPDCFGFQDD